MRSVIIDESGKIVTPSTGTSIGPFIVGQDGSLETDIRIALDTTNPKYRESLHTLQELLNQFREIKVLKSVSGI